MSVHMIELLIFAGIAFFIINRLIAALGSTSEEDPAKNTSYFGESVIKDITETSKIVAGPIKKKISLIKEVKMLDDLVVGENLTRVVEGVQILAARLPSFDAIKFLRNAKTAFQMIIEAYGNQQRKELEQLVDKRFIEKFEAVAADYGNFVDPFNIVARYSEIYMFGNTAFIKILFEGKNITEKLPNLKEEWTFTRSLISKEVDWFLANIEKI